MNEINPAQTAQHLKEINVYGYTHVENYLSSKQVDELKNLVCKYHDESKSISLKGLPDRDVEDKTVYNLQNKHKTFIDLLGTPFIKTILSSKLNDPYYRFLPPDVPNYILSYFNARSSGKELALHIDSHIPSPGDYTWAVQLAFILDNQTEENGCTVVVPGSHRSGSYTDRDLKNVKSILSRAGDLVIWDSRLWHGTRANINKSSRWAIIATFNMWWVKQAMDMPRSLPADIYSLLSNEQKALLGFCAITPPDEYDRINTKCGYDFLKPNLTDYHF